MRQLTILSMITLDGVMQAPGGPHEDTSGGFAYGGWTAPFGDEASGRLMRRLMQPADLLLGRKTFEIWENYWPHHTPYWPSINEVTKHVLSSTRNQSEWSHTVFLHTPEEIRALKQTSGRDLQVWGSSELIQLLLANDLADELWLMIHPITLGQGKKLFTQGAIPAAFTLQEHFISSDGVIMVNYRRAGAVRTGAVGE